MVSPTVSAAARLRAKSQLTLPESIVQAADVRAGERFVVEVDPGDPDVIRLRRVRRSYAGALRDVFADPKAYLEGERSTWERGERG
ncbi:MAG: hypothetical protein WEG56_00020 [Chloroflexota bacterium]